MSGFKNYQLNQLHESAVLFKPKRLTIPESTKESNHIKGGGKITKSQLRILPNMILFLFIVFILLYE